MKQDDAGMMIKQINDALSREANNALRGEDLTLSQLGVLEVLFEAEDYEMTLKEIEKSQHVSQPTVYGIVRRLEEKNFVALFDDDVNQKIRHVQLTPAGIGKARMGQTHMQEAERMLMRKLTREEQKQFLQLLAKVRDGMM